MGGNLSYQTWENHADRPFKTVDLVECRGLYLGRDVDQDHKGEPMFGWRSDKECLPTQVYGSSYDVT